MVLDFSLPMLGIDTSTDYLSVAVRVDGRSVVYHQKVGNKQSAHILPTIADLLAQMQINISDLGAIVYAQGPGAFTGLRIGIGVAQGLSLPFHIPLIGVPTLDAVAYQIEQNNVLAAIDARMGEVFYAWFDTQKQKRLSDYQVARIAQIIMPDGVNGDQINGIGNAFALTEAAHIRGNTQMPNAEDYLRLACSGRYLATDAAHASLLYVRNKVALTVYEQAQRRI